MIVKIVYFFICMLSFSTILGMDIDKYDDGQQESIINRIKELPEDLQKLLNSYIYKRYTQCLAPIVAHHEFNPSRDFRSITPNFTSAIVREEDGSLSLLNLEHATSKPLRTHYDEPWVIYAALNSNGSQALLASRPTVRGPQPKTLTLCNTETMTTSSLGQVNSDVAKIFMGNNHRIIACGEYMLNIYVSSDIKQSGPLSWDTFPAIKGVKPAVSEHGDFILTPCQDDPKKLRLLRITSDSITQIHTVILDHDVEGARLSNCGNYGIINGKLYDFRSANPLELSLTLPQYMRHFQSSKQGNYFIVSVHRGTTLYDMTNRLNPKVKIKESYKAQSSISAINDTGTTLIVFNQEKNKITLWDLVTMHSYELKHADAQAAGLSNNGHYVATIADTSIIVWNLTKLPHMSHFKIEYVDSPTTKFAKISDDGRFLILTKEFSEELIDLRSPLTLEQQAFLIKCSYLKLHKLDYTSIFSQKFYKAAFETFSDSQKAFIKGYFQVSDRLGDKPR